MIALLGQPNSGIFLMFARRFAKGELFFFVLIAEDPLDRRIAEQFVKNPQEAKREAEKWTRLYARN
jgi:hypothetical protein